MMTPEKLMLAARQAEALFVDLQKLYAQLPETRCRCRQPRVCCIFLPQMTLLEALQWLWIIQEMPQAQKKKYR